MVVYTVKRRENVRITSIKRPCIGSTPFPSECMGVSMPPVVYLSKKQAAAEARHWSIQYRRVLTTVTWPPAASPIVTAGFRCPPEMLNPAAIITAAANACVVPTNSSPTMGLAPALPAAMAEPTPAKTKRKVQMNSTTRALMHSGWAASLLVPKAIFAINP
uniref:Uncharacterized protein n=1 Tax=Opuntia streptacantha TaxID=393608 RepID=A0A7C8Z7G8_OPUST